MAGLLLSNTRVGRRNRSRRRDLLGRVRVHLTTAAERQAQPALLVLPAINVTRDLDAMLTRSMSMLMLRASMAPPKSRILPDIYR